MTPTKKIQVKMGPQPDLNQEVISAWAEPSSKGTTVYETQLRADGVISCNCPGWLIQVEKKCPKCGKILKKEKEQLYCTNCMRVVAPGDTVKARRCAHCQKHLEEAQAILDGKKPRVISQQPGLIQKIMEAGRPTSPRKLGRRMIITEGL